MRSRDLALIVVVLVLCISGIGIFTLKTDTVYSGKSTDVITTMKVNHQQEIEQYMLDEQRTKESESLSENIRVSENTAPTRPVDPGPITNDKCVDDYNAIAASKGLPLWNELSVGDQNALRNHYAHYGTSGW